MMVNTEKAMGSNQKSNWRQPTSELAWVETLVECPMAAGLDGIPEGQSMAEDLGGIKDVMALGYSAGEDDGTAYG